MKWNYIIAFLLIVFAFFILFISVFRTAAVSPNFSTIKQPSNDGSEIINYPLVYEGRILPGHPLWRIKAARDKLWLFFTTDPVRKAELNLLFADKRLGAVTELMRRGEVSNAYTSLIKAEQYLKIASDQELENRNSGHDTSEFLLRLANSSLKHQEVINEAKTSMPGNAISGIVLAENYTIEVYNRAKSGLMEKGITPPENPF